MFGIDWTGDGEVDIIDDIISMDVLGLLDDEENNRDDDFDIGDVDSDSADDDGED